MKVLVLGGGGTLGAFSAGALAALDEAGFVPDVLIGSSAGGINMLRWLVGGAREAVDFWQEVGRVRTIVRGLLTGKNWRQGILDAPWFRARVEQGLDWDRLLTDRRNLSFMVVDLCTGRVAVRGNRTEKDAAGLRACARGAYALPPLLPPVPHGRELLADGGLLHNAPLNAAVKLGATEIVYLCNVHALPFEGYAPQHVSSAGALWRYAEIFFRRASNVGFVDAEITGESFRGVPFLAIAPPAALRFGSLVRWALPGVDAAKHLIDTGYECGTRALSRWPVSRVRATAGQEDDPLSVQDPPASEMARA